LLCTESGLWPVVYTVVYKCIASCHNLSLNISCGNSQALDSLAEALQSRAVARILYLSRNVLEDSIGQGQWSVRPKPVTIKVQSSFTLMPRQRST